MFERYNLVSGCDLVEAAKKLNVLQSAAHPPEGGLANLLTRLAAILAADQARRFHVPSDLSLDFDDDRRMQRIWMTSMMDFSTRR